MPFVNNADSLKQWLMNCPVLKAGKAFLVDYAGGKPVEYSIFSVPSAIRYRKNVLGEEVPEATQELDCIFASTEEYGKAGTSDNLGLYQDITNWIMEQNAQRRFPAIEEGKVESIRPTLTAYVAAATASTARYQINIKITYRRFTDG